MCDNNESEQSTKLFYDRYWPSNVPDYAQAREHTLRFIPNRRFRYALDAGCGSGVSSIALTDRADSVTGIDISLDSLEVARTLARDAGAAVGFRQASLRDIPFAEETFDLVYCYGVLSFTSDPLQCLGEIVRVIEGGGVLVLAVYEKTLLSPVHDTFQRFLHRMPAFVQTAVLKAMAVGIALGAIVLRKRSQDYGLSVEAKLRDFYLTPYKHYFNPDNLGEFFSRSGLDYEVQARHTGRFKSASNIVFVCTKKPV